MDSETIKPLSLDNSIIIPKRTVDWISIIWIVVFLILICVMIFYPTPKSKITPYQEKVIAIEERKLKIEEENLKFSSYLINNHQLLAQKIDRFEKHFEKHFKIEDQSDDSESEEIVPRKKNKKSSVKKRK